MIQNNDKYFKYDRLTIVYFGRNKFIKWNQFHRHGFSIKCFKRNNNNIDKSGMY